MTQRTRLNTDGERREIRISNNDTTPSWKRYGEGRSLLEITSNPANNSLSLIAGEAYESEKRTVSREAWIEIDEHRARDLLEYLKNIYG